MGKDVLAPSGVKLGARAQRSAPVGGPPTPEQRAGRYVYAVARGGGQVSLGPIGIGGSSVYTVAHRDLCVLVHECPPQPYESGDAEVVAAWVLAHHRVVEAARQQWGDVLPLTFNTIVKAGQESPEKALVAWLDREYQSLKTKLDALDGKAEYGVQVFWDPKRVSAQVAQDNPEIRRVRAEAEAKSPGLAYMHRQRLEQLLREEMEGWAAQAFQELYGRLSRCADAIQVEKARGSREGRQMLMNLSCLVSTERYAELEAELNTLRATEGCSVRLVGPLPPYSFC